MKISLHNPLDMHVHLRDWNMLNTVWPLTAETFSWALVMPNLLPPIRTKQQIIEYKKRIIKSCKWEKFIPYMTLFFYEGITREILEDVQDEILWIKLYPAGITTNSEEGSNDIFSEKSKEIFSTMQELGIALNIHGETNDFVMDREKNFIPIYEKLAQEFPWLKIIMEHITTKESAELVQKYDNLFATITLHHLYITLDDVVGWMLQPHLFCKPIAKKTEDREALLKLALSWNKKVMFGSDSAPHPQSSKECSWCAAGIFTAPISLQLLAELFEKNNALDNLENFLTNNARKIYNLSVGNECIHSLQEKIITLEKKEFTIPEKYWDVVPFMAGEKIEWSLII